MFLKFNSESGRVLTIFESVDDENFNTNEEYLEVPNSQYTRRYLKSNFKSEDEEGNPRLTVEDYTLKYDGVPVFNYDSVLSDKFDKLQNPKHWIVSQRLFLQYTLIQSYVLMTSIGQSVTYPVSVQIDEDTELTAQNASELLSMFITMTTRLKGVIDNIKEEFSTKVQDIKDAANVSELNQIKF